jgi:hypothetical protein
MKRPTITKTLNCAVARDGSGYWESVHEGVLPAQKAADLLAMKRRKVFSVYKWDEADKSAKFVSVHKPGAKK